MVFDPNKVGALIIHTFNFGTTLNFNFQDGYLLTFPSSFELPDDGTLGASLEGNQMNVYVYPDQYQMFIECPDGVSIGTTSALTIS